MNKFYFAMLLAGMMAAVTGCENDSDDDNDANEPSRVSLSEVNNGAEVSVATGDIVEIDLPGNPTTGFDWKVADTDKSRLEFMGSTFTPDSDLVGSGGTYRFRFRAVAAGDVFLRLVYKRSGDAAPADTFTATIHIS